MQSKNWLGYLIGAAMLLASLHVSSQHNSQLLAVDEGDLLFVAQAGDNAITQVTQGVDNLAIDHVAIMHRIGGDDGPLYAL